MRRTPLPGVVPPMDEDRRVGPSTRARACAGQPTPQQSKDKRQARLTRHQHFLKVFGVLAVMSLITMLTGCSGSDIVPAPAPTVTVTAPPPVISTVTQTESQSVIIVPDPTTVYPDYDGPFGLPAGLLCRNLKDMGYSYSDAIYYWNYHGQPDEMDIDLNGIPCETVY